MSDKDDLNEVMPGNEGHDEADSPLSDLSADPEFLALAADFDAAIKGGQNDTPEYRPEPEEPQEIAADEVIAVAEDGAAWAEAGPEPEAQAVEEPEEVVETAQEAVAVKEKGGLFSGRFGRKKEKKVEPEAEQQPEAESQPGPEAAPAFEDEPGEPDESQEKAPEKQKTPKPIRLKSEAQAEATLLSRLFDSLALGALFILTAAYLFQVIPGLEASRLLWFSDELRQADVLAGVFNGNWLQIQLNGQLYQEAPPFYFWFLMGMHKLMALAGLDLGSDYARLLYVGAAASGLFFLWATYAMARSTARLDRRGAFAAGCVLLSVLFLQFFFHYSSLDLFFAAFIVASHVFLFKALMRERAPLYMGLAFLCAAVALLSKGALGLVLPVLSSVLFSLWRGKLGRLLKGDFLLGVLLALLPSIIWLGSIWASGQHDVVLELLREQVWVKAFGDPTHHEPWWFYFAVMPALWLPWSFMLLTLPWHRLLSGQTWQNIKSARSGERQGLAFVWIFFLGGFALMSALSHKQTVYLVPLMGPLAILTGRAALQLSPLRSKVLQRLMAVLFFMLAVAFVLLPVYYSGSIPSFFSWLEKITLPAWEIKINGIFLLAVIMLGTSCLLLGLLKARRPESTMLVLLLSATLFSYPLATMTMPSLDDVVSSKDASIELKRYADLGYYPVSFKIYSGVFSYYSGMIINETSDWAELDRMISSQQKILVAMSASRWQSWTQNPGFTEVMRFWMFSNEYVLLLRNTVQEELPPIEEEPEESGALPELEGPMPQEAFPGEELMPGGALPEEVLPEEAAPAEAMPEEPRPEEALPEETGAEEAALPSDGASADDTSGERQPVAEEAKPEGETAEEPAPSAPAETESAPEGQESQEGADEPAHVEPDPGLPDGLPLSDEPTQYDPFAPVPAE